MDSTQNPSPDKNISELIDLVKRVLSDGRVTDDEAKALEKWISDHPDAASTWPGDILAKRLKNVIADGRISEVERMDLYALLATVSKGKEGNS